ncbi:Hypothetical protein A7982_06054 [Minicystis rosea]|nr:Hypothetical protein A7982_06054 [Minicystis rosea]
MVQRKTEDWSERLARWGEARARLRLRLYTDAWAAAQRAPLIAEQRYPGLTAVVVLDLPDVVATASEDHLAWWQKSREEVIATALANALAEPVEPEVMSFDDVDVLMLDGGHVYASAYALAPEKFPAGVGPGGSLVALPDRNLVMLHPLGQAPVDDAVFVLAGLVLQSAQHYEAPLCNDLFWFRERGRPPVRIGAATDDETVRLIADESVLEQMRVACGERR